MDSDAEDFKTKEVSISRRRLFEIMKESQCKKFDEKIDYLEKYLSKLTKCPDDYIKDLRRHYSHFKSDFKQRWVAARHTDTLFVHKNEEWLKGIVKLPVYTHVRTGRPSKSFADSSDQTKRRKTSDIRSERSPEELCFAAQMSLRKSGHVDAAKVLRDITNPSTPQRAEEYRKAITVSQVSKLSPTDALSLFVEADLTRRQYNLIQQADKMKFPSYSTIQKEKMKCYPRSEAFTVTSTCAELKLQPLMDHTAERLCVSLKEIWGRLSAEEKKNLKSISKWGCDGSQQRQYKQRFQSDSDSDANIFQSSFSYLQLLTQVDGHRKVVWQNPTPSPRYCRPIRIRFIRESTDVTNNEIDYIMSQIRELNKSSIEVEGESFVVEHELLLTMVDGKICNAVTDTKYTHKCYICAVTSSKFNDLSDMTVFSAKAENFRFGLSILHARIRFFESLLHLSYKLPIKEWKIKKNSPNAKIVEDRKEAIQESFKKEMGLLVDMPTVGLGNTNDGNTSRRFFSDVEKSAAITGLDKELLKRYKVILEVVSGGLSIDTEKFSLYALDTAKLYVQLYGWYPMPPTVHKLLIHGADIISSAILPIGQLSEEAAEARNKYFRKYRLGFSRKFSREACNRDILNRLLLTSDPLLTGLSLTPKKKTRPFSKETIEMLLPEEVSKLTATTSEATTDQNEEHGTISEDDSTSSSD